MLCKLNIVNAISCPDPNQGSLFSTDPCFAHLAVWTDVPVAPTYAVARIEMVQQMVVNLKSSSHQKIPQTPVPSLISPSINSVTSSFLILPWSCCNIPIAEWGYPLSVVVDWRYPAFGMGSPSAPPSHQRLSLWSSSCFP